ncbi:hypothetical protein BJX62DRAFT_243330 [Aspergillus germanicus]
MKVFQTVVLALASIPALASAAPPPPSDPAAPRTAILSFKPAWGKADQLEAYVKEGQEYIRANVPACLDIWYTNQTALWEWALSEEHTNIAKDLPRLIDIFSAKIQADISIDIKDLLG